jgi:hypothetical protein
MSPVSGVPSGEPVAQEHDAVRAGDGRFEQRDVRGHRAAVEHVLPDAEHDRVEPEVEAVGTVTGGAVALGGVRSPSPPIRRMTGYGYESSSDICCSPMALVVTRAASRSIGAIEATMAAMSSS